jgi:hypothetical protein
MTLLLLNMAAYDPRLLQGEDRMTTIQSVRIAMPITWRQPGNCVRVGYVCVGNVGNKHLRSGVAG